MATGADQSDAAIAPRLPLVALGAAALLLLAAALAGRDLWFFSDDWNIYADYHAGGLLEPFNGHLSLVPAAIYLVLFHTVGMDSYLPYRLSGLVALAVLAFQLVRFTHSRLGDRGPDAVARGSAARGSVVVALAVTAVLWNSAGTMNLLFPFLMNFSLPIAALVATWWHLDRADGDDAPHSLRHEVLASLWLCLALATSGLGLMTLAAVGVELVVSRAPWRRLAVMAPGPLLWAVWYVGHRDANEISTDVAAVAAYCARMFLGATTSLAAGSTVLGVLLAVLTVVFFALAAWRWRSLDARTLGALAAPATFILFTAVTRLDIVPAIPPDELRYSWAVAAYLVLAAVVAARRTPMFDVGVPRGAWIGATAVVLVVLGLGAVRLWDSMQDWNRQVAEARPGLSTVLFATEAVGAERMDPDVVIPLSYVPVTTGGYLSAAADVGSPIAEANAAELGGAAYNRQVADQLLVEQLGIGLTGVEGSPPCRAERPLPVGPSGELLLEPGTAGVQLRHEDPSGAVTARISRFTTVGQGIELFGAGQNAVAWLTLPDDDPAVADMPGLSTEWPYRLQLPSGVTAIICG